MLFYHCLLYNNYNNEVQLLQESHYCDQFPDDGDLQAEPAVVSV